MLDLPLSSLLEDYRPGRLGSLLGKAQQTIYKLAGRDRYDDFRLERVHGMPIVVIPTVANPKLLRTGAFFASQLSGESIARDSDVLDLGTGTGVCALTAAQHARRVTATDINRAAVCCARINALINGLNDRIDARQGDLFDPVADEQFDLVLFNPPFVSGVPGNAREAAWLCGDIPERFAAGLADRLKPGGTALLLLSSYGDACGAFESELRSQGFQLTLVAQRRLINELIIILKATPSSAHNTNT